MKVEEMRTVELDSMSLTIEDLRRELLELRCKVALGEDVRPHRIREIKREIARMLTIMRERGMEKEAEGEE